MIQLTKNRDKYIRRALESFKRELEEGSSKFESAFADLISDIDEYPEFEDFTLQAQSLYLKSQDLIGEVTEHLKSLIKE